MSLINSTAIPSGATGYEIDQSLRFNDDDNTQLERTFTSAGDRKKWTWSAWIKRGNIATNMTLFSAKANTGNIWLAGVDGIMRVEHYNGAGGYDFRRDFDGYHRDASAWYHFIIVYDSAQGSEVNRIKFYRNGEAVGVDTTANAMTQNFQSAFNSNETHWLGAINHGLDYDGCMAEVNFVDGQALTPSDFGETGDYGEWKPIAYSGSYGTNGFYLNFAGGGIMSATGGNSTATDGDYKAASFTANGTFTPSADGYVEYLVIGGGGGGGGGAGYAGGGGGAGGYRTGYLPVTGSTAYSITVGSGGSANSTVNGSSGGDSVFSTITSDGGGYGSYGQGQDGGDGGSGGGAGANRNDGVNTNNGGSATAGQGNDGGNGGYPTSTCGAGGGGAGAAAADIPSGTEPATAGGAGLASSITGSSVTRAGGGGGAASYNLLSNQIAVGGSGGGGDGGARQTANGGLGGTGTANTGAGGGGGGPTSNSGGAGGSGIVIIRYKFQ